MPKFSWGRCVRMLVVLLGILHISFVILLIILSSFFISSFLYGTVFKILIFGFRLAREMANNWSYCLAFFSVISFCKFHLSEGIN